MDRGRLLHFVLGAWAGFFISMTLWEFGVPLAGGFVSRLLFFLAGVGGGLVFAAAVTGAGLLIRPAGRFVPSFFRRTLRILLLLVWPLLVLWILFLLTAPMDVYTGDKSLPAKTAPPLLFSAVFLAAAALVFLPRSRLYSRMALGAAFLVVIISWFYFSERRPERGEGVVLVTIDTLRSDYLGCYGHEGGTSPFLDKIAERGVRFQRAYATAPVTGPSHVAMLTGLYPRRSGVIFNGYPASYSRIDSLARVFADQGYHTAAITSRVRLNPAELEVPGFKYISCPEVRALDTPASEATRRAGIYLRERGDGPFFLWVHYWDPHSPFFPPKKYREKFAPGVQSRGDAPVWLDKKNALSENTISEFRSLYKGEISYTDDEIERLFDFTERLTGNASNLTWVFVADHGELLGEIQHKYPYGFGHYDFIYEETLRVPWIMYGKNVPGRGTIRQRVSTVDLAPTLLDLLDLPGLREKDGKSLAPLLNRSETDTEGPVFFERWIPEKGPLPQSKEPLHGMIWQDMKWIGSRSGHDELYNLSTDPDEQHDLAGRRPELVAEMRKKWEKWDKENPETSPDADRKLPVSVGDFRALGYFK